jgi:catechol 2,3-dioxygenase-like lactoylglutathione lyase family enzyme
VTFSFDHVPVVCVELDATGRFLRETIGATEIRRNEAIRNWEFELDGVRIFVRECREVEPLSDAVIRREGVDHLGFAVADIDAAIATLSGAGCVVTQSRTQVRAGLVTAVLMGPGGMLVELLQRG